MNNNNLVILDWDNTLFPTTWINENNIDLNNLDIKKKYFNKLDNLISILLLEIIKYSEIMIITNALPEWITICTDKVLPKTKKILKHHNIKIISARKNYKKISNNINDWKKFAFIDEIDLNIKNIISIGDDLYEYNALINLDSDNNDSKFLKSIKFIYRPTIFNIYSQLDILIYNIKKIILTKNHLDLIYHIDI